MQRKIANSAQRTKNRTRWRQDLKDPQRENDRCLERTKMTYPTPGAESTQQWCAGGRATQLLIDSDDMFDHQHPDLASSPAAAWTFTTHCPTAPDEYPLHVTAITDINHSAFRNFYDMMEQIYGVDRETMQAIERANDQGNPMRHIADMIPA